jgi:microcystin-dependent protein
VIADTAGAISAANLTNAPNPILPGTIAYVGMNSLPAGWLKANGAAISRTAYAALFLAIGTTYGAGDGLTTFNVPDLRGEFVRSLDDGRGVDSGRGIGTAQSHQMGSHTHSMPQAYLAGWNGNNIISGGTQGGATVVFSSNATGGTSNGNENRPRNVALQACIKY